MSATGAVVGANGRDATHQRDEGLAVVEAGGRGPEREGQAVPVDDQVDFRSALAGGGRIRSRQPPPLRARTLTESIAHRDQSSSPREPSSSRTRRWSLAHTPASDHSQNRRNAVTPDKPKPGGNWFHVQPETATKMIAANTPAHRTSAGRRPAGAPEPAPPPA